MTRNPDLMQLSRNQSHVFAFDQRHPSDRHYEIEFLQCKQSSFSLETKLAKRVRAVLDGGCGDHGDLLESADASTVVAESGRRL